MNNIEEKSNEEVVDVKALQDTEADILSAYQADNKKIHFAGDNLKSLQKEMNGGLMCERLYLFGGVPGFGVTTLLNNLADNLCLDSHPVLFFSYGVGKSELRYRTFARFSKFAIQDFDNKDIKPDMIQKILIDPKIQTIEKFKYILEDRMGIEAWEPMIAEIQATHGEGPVVIIDNIRKIFTREAFNEERFRIEYILSNLMGFAKKYRIPIIASSELNRAHYTHQNISKGNWDLACLKESVPWNMMRHGLA